MSRLFIRHLALVVALALSCAAAQASLPWPRIALNRVASGFSNPTQVTSAHDGTGRLFVVEQTGSVRIVKDGAVLPNPFLDITNRVSCCGERGLLSIVFPPGSGLKGQFWADYTDVNGDTAISLFSFSGDTASAVSETVLLKIAQPFANHNGGQLAFGPDGDLYVGMGDGGSAGDPNNNAQNLGSLLGKILRIDVRAFPYGIPPDNPFAGSSTARREIWAYGLRNPWRFSFDRKTGDLYIGDVGQGAWEEVDFQPAASVGGENYGWRLTEGNHCFNPASGCSFAGITPPVAEYSHASGCSITGGFVYRGRDFARLDGIYFYADYCSGRVWGLRRNGTGWETQELLQPGFGFTSFGEDDAGEVYAVDGNSGTLYRLVDADGPLSVLTVPVVVDAAGANGERFVSEITLGNRGTTDASVAVSFTAASALGSTGTGTFTTAVPAGRQLVFTDAIQWLRQNGLSVPLGGQGGTLRLAYSGLSSGDTMFASVRTLAVLPEGRAGLAYPALSPNETLDAPAALYGLRENTVFRSNLALLHAGDPATGGPVTLRVTVFNGEAGDGRNVVLPDVTLAAGQWTQLNRVLQSAGYANGWATVERIAGTDAFYAYGVVNDNLTGDGAFVAPMPVGRTTDALTLPVAVHTSAFTTEIILTNAGTREIRLSFLNFSGRDVILQPHEQRFIPDVLSYLGTSALAMSLEIYPNGGVGVAAFHASARTFSSTPVGGTFGVAYPAISRPEAALSETWVYGLKQDGLNRSNLAFGNVAAPGAFPGTPPNLTLSVDFFDADTGVLRGSRSVSFIAASLLSLQLNAPLSSFGIRNGYVRVRAPAGNPWPFFVYGVVNDGAAPGQGTGDGSYLAMTAVK